MTEATYAHLIRILELARLLTQQRVSRAELAERFGISERQAGRDIMILRRAGFAVTRTRRGYRLAECPMCGRPVEAEGSCPEPVARPKPPRF